MQRVGGRGPRASAGFTLIEVMITVAIVAILAGIAYPTYTDYIVRGRLVDAATALRATRARMEQYYQDNRTYTSVSSSIVSPCMDTQVVRSFAVLCESTPTASAYTITARGSGSTAGFVFTIDQSGTERTQGLPSRWGTVPSGGYACWVLKKGETC